MSLITVTEGYKQKIMDEFTECGKRVFVVPSLVSYLLMESYETPGVAIIYAGGNPSPDESKPVKQFETHYFDIYIIRTIWKEEKVVLGEADHKGLVQLLQILVTILEDYKFDNVIFTGVTEYYGTADYVRIGREGFSASIGFKIKCFEQV